MHGKGPAPAGNLPVAVHLSARRVALPGTAGAAHEAVVRLTVACGPEPATGAVELDVPPGLEATPGGPLRYDLPALGHAHWDLTVRGAAGAAPGHYFLAARIRDQLGQVLEDVTAVLLGGPPLPDLDLPLDALLPALRADEQAIAAEVQVTVLTPEIRVRPGRRRGTGGAGGQPGRLPGPRRGAADFAVRQLAGVASLDARFLRLPRKRGNSPLSCRGTDYYPARHAVVDNGQTDVFRSTSLHQQRSRTHLRMKESTLQGAGSHAINQTVLDAMTSAAPPAPGNLPAEPNSFIGRERDLSELALLLSDVRALTLCGPGGIGKTRLAVRLACDLVPEFPDGAWLVELADTADADLLPRRVAATFGIREEQDRPLIATLAEALRARRLLLVLDTCEHIVDGCAELVQQLLAELPVTAGDRDQPGAAAGARRDRLAGPAAVRADRA